MDLKVGGLYHSDSASLWADKIHGIHIGYLDHDDLVIILQIQHDQVQVLTTSGTTGWVDKITRGRFREP